MCLEFYSSCPESQRSCGFGFLDPLVLPVEGYMIGQVVVWLLTVFVFLS